MTQSHDEFDECDEFAEEAEEEARRLAEARKEEEEYCMWTAYMKARHKVAKRNAAGYNAVEYDETTTEE